MLIVHCRSQITHPVFASLDHPLFAARKEGRNRFLLNIQYPVSSDDLIWSFLAARTLLTRSLLRPTTLSSLRGKREEKTYISFDY